MRIKPLRGMVGSYGKLTRNVDAEVPDAIAQQLVKRGVAVPVQAEAKKEGAGKAGARPSPKGRSRSGGRTGAGK